MHNVICERPLRVNIFHTGDKGSVGQRAAKLLVVKVGAHTKKSAASAIIAKMSASTSAWVRVHLGSNHSQNFTDCNFEAF